MPTAFESIFADNEKELIEEWQQNLRTSGAARVDLIPEGELRGQCGDLLRLLRSASAGGGADPRSNAYEPVRARLAEISKTRAIQGFSPSATAAFVFTLKKAVFAHLRRRIKDPDKLGEEIWAANEVLDDLGLYTTEIFQKSREEVINRQQQDLLELSTPVVKLWDGVLALPLIGTLDSARTQVVMESLLTQVVATGSSIAIIDITGVPTVDTLVAQHLIKTVTAARLMGADCIISGIRPSIAQTIVHLGIDLTTITTKASLADAFRAALTRLNLAVGRKAGPAPVAGAAGAKLA